MNKEFVRSISIPQVSTYGEYSTGNYGAHCIKIHLNELRLTIYYSYRTPVAFFHPSTNLVVRKNEWGPTTGKHLRWIDDGNKKDRVDGVVFHEQLEKVLLKAYLGD